MANPLDEYKSDFESSWCAENQRAGAIVVGGGRSLIGFKSTNEPSIRGSSQALLEPDDLETIDLSETALVLGSDRRVYEDRFGLIECLAPAKMDKTEPLVYVKSVDWESFPPMAELAYLFDTFFDQYDREVVMIVGKKRDGSGWLYHVPEQTGSPGRVSWDADDEEMDAFANQARWVGTIHVHPGSSCTPSQTDVDDWAKPEKSGLHLIFGRGGFFTINGSIAGQTFPLEEGTLDGVDRKPVEFTTSRNRTLDEILKEPQVFVQKRWPQLEFDRYSQTETYQPAAAVDVDGRSRDYEDYVETALATVGALKANRFENLWTIIYDNQLYLLTNKQLQEMREWCDGVCPLPTTHRLHLRRRGGK